RSFLTALFTPMAQGTIRPLSERLFFMVFVNLFGMDALPFRIAVFLTMFADLVLLCIVVNRLARSRIAGFAAACLWVVNVGLSTPLSWTSAYNQILCAFFLLLAFWCWLRFTETAERRWYWWLWLPFLLGFGALEMNVIYPALAGLYALCCARRYLIWTLPMFAASAIFTLVHRSVAPRQTGEIYRMYFDTSIATTLATYIRWTIGQARFFRGKQIDYWLIVTAEAVVAVGIIAAIVWMIRRRQWLVLLFAGWFLIAIGPVLPLKNHISDYYLTIPSIGLAMLGGWTVAQAWRAPRHVQIAAAVVVLAYAVPSAQASWRQTRWNWQGSQRAKAFLERVAYAHKLHPNKILLIRNMDSELFWIGFYGDPFRIFGLRDIYLTADAEPRIEPFNESGPLTRYFLAETAALHAISHDKAVVYEVSGEKLRNVTDLYARLLASRGSDLEFSPRVEVAQAAYEPQVIDGFYAIEDRFRWMSKRGVVRVRGPRNASEKLEVSGTCPEQHMLQGPLRLAISVEGRPIATHEINRSNLAFTFRDGLPADLVGMKSIDVAIEAERTISTPTDDRKLGVVITTVSIGQ
ncbi:MAG TPA: glycosyltransferase family 39 protein, partial [Bryobacteraceae bacterium]|nr:glycosyltransferase family 39 protein [Bryobacteraceae bacterium]